MAVGCCRSRIAALVLPAAPGHEIVGRVARLGPDASGVAVGDLRLVYPWVGCGHCAHCRAEEENYCNGQRSLGVTVNGGFGGLVKVPHSRYLIPFDGIDPALAATYACSGLMANAAMDALEEGRVTGRLVLMENRFMTKWITLAICLAIATPAAAQMSKPTIKIGVLADFSSSYQDISGKGSVAAAQLAVDEFGAKIAGIPIEVVSADVQSKPDIASAIARQWYDQDGVDIILDLPASNVALAVQDLARTRGKISVTTGGGSTDLTGKSCSPTGFHWVWDTYAMAHGAGQAIVQAGGKSWFFITGDFAAAITLEREASEAVTANGGTLLGSARAPFPNTDFSSQLLLAKQSGRPGARRRQCRQ